MSYQAVTLLDVTLHHYDQVLDVGRLALKDRQIYFEYAPSFIKKNIPFSPFQLPLAPNAHSCNDIIFDGIFGVFNDSLPDGWGRLLLDRHVEQHGINRRQLGSLDRLAYVGKNGMGALCYEPDYSTSPPSQDTIDLQEIANECQIVLQGEHGEIFDELLALNGSSMGARPKVVVGASPDKSQLIYGTTSLPETFSHWMVKFPSSNDPDDIGAIEYAYNLMAKDAGIEVPESHLFTTQSNQSYFGSKRFDRDGNQRIHMQSLCGLIHADHRTPSLDYESILKTTYVLCKDINEVTKVFYLACFNVFAHNRDDHSKNFSFIMDQQYCWHASPAYDLTFSYGPAGEQSTMVMGEGQSPCSQHLKQLGNMFEIPNTQHIIEQVKSVVTNWMHYAKEANVSKKSALDIQKHLEHRVS